MKTKLLTIACALFAAYGVNATVHTVANFPPNSAQYPTITSAIAAASAGDTIYINGSPTAYDAGGVDVTKRLVFIGTGYADSAEGNLNSMISGTVTFDSVAGVSGSSACQFIGISFQGGINNANNEYPKNVFFSGCLFTNGNLDVYNDGWVIQNCMFASCYAGLIIDYSPVNSCIIQNNYFTIGNCNGYSIGFSGNVLAAGLIVDHNFFEGHFGGSIGSYAIITNNVFFYASAVSSTNLQNCQISNNLFIGSTRDSLPPGSGITTNTIFNNLIAPASLGLQLNNSLAAIQGYPGLLSYNWKLLATSIGHNSGTDGTDAGPFGGFYPINMNGSPIPPQMFQMNLSSLVPIGGNLQVQFQARQQKQ